MHSLGLKFGLYVTPGISKQAVAQNTAIKGTSYHADDIATTATENNYNCGGMVGIDYSKPGAQDFVDSWADQFAGWGIDYLKIDGVGTPDIGDVRAWSQALKQTGRPIHLELSNSLDINNAAGLAAALRRLADRRRHRVLLRPRRQQLPPDHLVLHHLPLRPGRGLGPVRWTRPATTTTTRWRSATAPTTGSPPTSAGPR